jgi:hypothetical protein
MAFLSNVILVAVTALPFILIAGALIEFCLTRESSRHIR